MIPEVIIITDEEGNEVAVITNKEGKFTVTVAEGYETEVIE